MRIGYTPQQGTRLGPDGSTMAREKGRPAMLGCVTVFGLLLGGICGCGLGLGLLLHWLVPAIDRGMAKIGRASCRERV